MAVAFLDFEAAGLKSFPVEVAWCAGDLSAGGSWLIAPGAWIGGDPMPDPPTWDPDAERLHGLTVERLRADGRPPAMVAQALRDDLAAYDAVISDCPETDWRWAAMLFDAAKIGGVPNVIAVEETEIVDLMFPYERDVQRERRAAVKAVCKALGLVRHHALPDAMRQAIALCVARGARPEAIEAAARALLIRYGRPETRRRQVIADSVAFVDRHQGAFAALRDR